MTTSYPADFPADRVYEPVQPEVFLWVDPLIIGALLLAALLIAAFAWWIGRTQAGREPDAAESIWKAIDDAIKAAMKADNHGIAGKAQALRDVIDRRLGKTLKLAGGLKLKALDEALKGRAPADGHGHGGGHAPGGHAAHAAHTPSEVADGHGTGSASAAAAAANITIVTVTPGTATTHEPPVHPPHTPEHRELTASERNNALRLAVADLNEHWRDKAARIGELRAAHAELSGH